MNKFIDKKNETIILGGNYTKCMESREGIVLIHVCKYYNFELHLILIP